jgi:hypothetical protein
LRPPSALDEGARRSDNGFIGLSAGADLETEGLVEVVGEVSTCAELSKLLRAEPHNGDSVPFMLGYCHSGSGAVVFASSITPVR